MRGVPGWDWLHFVIQTEVLVRKTPAAKVFARIQRLVHSPAWTKYATLNGIVELSTELLLAYLINALDIVGQTKGVGILRELLRHARKNLFRHRKTRYRGLPKKRRATAHIIRT